MDSDYANEIMGTKFEVYENYQPLYPPHQKPCIYFLLQKDEIVYVGQTISYLTDRIKNHLADKQFDGLSWIIYNLEPKFLKGGLNYWESYWIAHFEPKYNKQMPPNDHYLSIYQIPERCGITPTQMYEILAGVKPHCIIDGNPFYFLPDLSDYEGYTIEVDESCLT